ncbi:hypothetical protein [Roseateles sp.]|uniref:hypothetical protein n=1 Tax=Roseateles sp. TaxID=1971397 RepID=UPI0039EA4DAB
MTTPLQGVKYAPSDFPDFRDLAPNRMGGKTVELLKKVLVEYDLASTVAATSGLMTIPKFQPFALRLELLSQLALGACKGKKKPTLKNFDTWLNRQLGAADVKHLEDPPEDVFVLNVSTHHGGFRIFRGLWEEQDHALELLFRALGSAPDDVSRAFLDPAIALLRLSDAVVRRSGLQRWEFEHAPSRREVQLRGCLEAPALAQRVTFSAAGLLEEGIAVEHLQPFLLNDIARAGLLDETDEETQHLLYPVLCIGDQHILTVPSAVSYAIRRFMLRLAKEHGLSETLSGTVFREARAELAGLVRHGSRHGPQFLPLPKSLQGIKGRCFSIVLGIAKRHFLHYMLVASSTDEVDSFGLNVPLPPAPELAEHADAVRAYADTQHEFSAGHTIVVGALLGEMTRMPEIPARDGWTAMGTSLGDIAILLHDSDSPQDRLFALLSQLDSMERTGSSLMNFNGLLNLYHFWVKQHFYLRVPPLRHDQPSHAQIELDYVRSYRQARRQAEDEHVVPLPGGQMTIVVRANANASYPSLRSIPAYVSLDLMKEDVLAFYMPVGDRILWITARPPNDKAARNAVFELWQSLQYLLHRCLMADNGIAPLQDSPSGIMLDFAEVVSQEAAEADLELPTGIETGPSEFSSVMIVEPAPGFLRNFGGAENDGEVLFLSAVLEAFEAVQIRLPSSNKARKELALKVLGGPSAKVIHALKVWHDVEMLLLTAPKSAYAPPTERIIAARQTSFAWGPSSDKVKALDMPGTVAAFGECVAHHVSVIQTQLRKWNRVGTIEKLLDHNESLIKERQRWRTSARAVLSLYGIEEGTQTAQESEQERAQLQVTIRALIEAATCECPDTVERTPDDYDVDDLVGQMANIIDLGRNSDVAYFGLANGGLRIAPNGSYGAEAAPLAELATPFMAHSFSETYGAAAGDYERWVRTEAPVKEEADDLVFESAKFLAAWQAEYGLPFDAFRYIAGALQNIAVREGRVVLTCTPSELKEAASEGGVSITDVQAFLAAFGLPRREAWPADPPASAYRDVMPWRFERRLSVSLKPLILHDERGSTFTYGLGTARESLAYVLDSIQRASFDKDVFSSKEMRSWLGGRVDELGARFSESVAERLRALGWQARTERKLTELGAPKNPNLGDVDVLAWHPDGRVLAMECKRLKASRTIAEIAQNCKRFQGNVDDLLHKHLRRKAWLEANPAKLAAFCKLSPDAMRVSYPLVVNRAVPFKYVSSLPIPASDIVVDEALPAYIGGS